jgi:hypothetical protein
MHMYLGLLSHQFHYSSIKNKRNCHLYMHIRILCIRVYIDTYIYQRTIKQMNIHIHVYICTYIPWTIKPSMPQFFDNEEAKLSLTYTYIHLLYMSIHRYIYRSENNQANEYTYTCIYICTLCN